MHDTERKFSATTHSFHTGANLIGHLVEMRLDERSEAVKNPKTANDYASDHQQRSAVGEQCYVSDNQLQSQQGDSNPLQT